MSLNTSNAVYDARTLGTPRMLVLAPTRELLSLTDYRVRFQKMMTSS